MDYADDDAVTRYERWEKALIELAQNWTMGTKSDIPLQATALLSENSLTRMKREAIISAAQQEGDEHLPRLQKSFPGVALAPLIQALRVKYVELRLTEG